MTIHDIGISAMQQQDMEANQGYIVYNIKFHSLKSESEQKPIED